MDSILQDPSKRIYRAIILIGFLLIFNHPCITFGQMYIECGNPPMCLCKDTLDFTYCNGPGVKFLPSFDVLIREACTTLFITNTHITSLFNLVLREWRHLNVVHIKNNYFLSNCLKEKERLKSEGKDLNITIKMHCKDDLSTVAYTTGGITSIDPWISTIDVNVSTKTMIATTEVSTIKINTSTLYVETLVLISLIILGMLILLALSVFCCIKANFLRYRIFSVNQQTHSEIPLNTIYNPTTEMI